MENRQQVVSHCLVTTVKGVEQEGVPAGLSAECRVWVETDDGTVSDEAQAITVREASSATIYITAATNFVNYQDVSGNPSAKNEAIIASLKGRTFQNLLETHVAKYHNQYHSISACH